MDFDEVRRIVITALFSDDALVEKLVLQSIREDKQRSPGRDRNPV
jgi:hypothetical protein